MILSLLLRWRENLLLVNLIVVFLSVSAFGAVPLKDNILFGFEKCKSLSVDLEKGQLKETVTSSFDVHCRKKGDLELECTFYETGSSKKLSQENFTGGSDLGVGELKDIKGRKIRFLIGKNFASYESGSEQKVCIGIHIFEKDAMKVKKEI